MSYLPLHLAALGNKPEAIQEDKEYPHCQSAGSCKNMIVVITTILVLLHVVVKMVVMMMIIIIIIIIMMTVSIIILLDGKDPAASHSLAAMSSLGTRQSPRLSRAEDLDERLSRSLG